MFAQRHYLVHPSAEAIDGTVGFKVSWPRRCRQVSNTGSKQPRKRDRMFLTAQAVKPLPLQK